MTQAKGIYKCELCGNIVELLHLGGGELVCCGQSMRLVSENSIEASKEKHIPVIEVVSNGIKVKVGSIAHPMEEKHFIEWIEISVDGKVCKKFLKPGDAPEAVFPVSGEVISARAYCNLHGLWKN